MDSKSKKSLVVLFTFNSYHHGLNKPYSVLRVPLKDSATESLGEEIEDLTEILLSNFYDLEPKDVLNLDREENSHGGIGHISGDSPSASISKMTDKLMNTWDTSRTLPKIILKAFDKDGKGIDPKLDDLFMTDSVSWN